MAQLTAAEVKAMRAVPEYPSGTVDEAMSAGLPLNVIPTCAQPNPVAGVRGCKLWNECLMSYKGKSAADGGGPRNHCWERIKSAEDGGAIVRNVHPCFYGVSQQEIVQENKAVLRVIADEGEEYETLTSISSPTATDPFNREVKLVRMKVAPFERVRDQKPMQQALLRAELKKKEQERVASERAGEALGVEGASTPLDKRGGRGGKRGEA